MKTLGIVTTSRADYGHYEPILERLLESPIDVELYVTGSHLSHAHGHTIDFIDHPITEVVDTMPASDSPEAIGMWMGATTTAFARVFARRQPDMLMVLGDRVEMHAVALAALIHRIPIAHIHGGELSQGSIDDTMRHSITKMAHIHFVAHEEYKRRVVQLGEEPWRVHVSGAPGLDGITEGLKTLRELDIDVNRPPIVIVLHPETGLTGKVVFNVVESKPHKYDIVAIHPGHDPGSWRLMRGVVTKATLERRDYLSLLSHAAVLVGNSSSGIIEAASFELPVVNIGNRQDGRIKPRNVIDTPNDPASISRALKYAMSDYFRIGLDGLENPYKVHESASGYIVGVLETLIGTELPMKRFHDPHEHIKAEVERLKEKNRCPHIEEGDNDATCAVIAKWRDAHNELILRGMK